MIVRLEAIPKGKERAVNSKHCQIYSLAWVSTHKAVNRLLFIHSVMSNSLQPHGLAAHQASLSFTISWSLLKLMSIESIMPSNINIVKCQPTPNLHDIIDLILTYIPWRRKWQPTPVLLPGKFHGLRSLVGYSPWGRRVGHDWATSFHFTHLYLPDGLSILVQISEEEDIKDLAKSVADWHLLEQVQSP